MIPREKRARALISEIRWLRPTLRFINRLKSYTIQAVFCERASIFSHSPKEIIDAFRVRKKRENLVVFVDNETGES